MFLYSIIGAHKCIQTVCKGYQQTTKVASSMERVNIVNHQNFNVLEHQEQMDLLTWKQYNHIGQVFKMISIFNQSTESTDGNDVL